MSMSLRSKTIIISTAVIFALGTSACGVSPNKKTSSNQEVATTAPAAAPAAKPSAATVAAQASTSPQATAKLDPTVAPGGNFDLTKWQLQLPTGSPGSITTVSGSNLKGANGFTNTYFYTDKTDGAMTLMDPVTGATTSGSLHPRTELREVTNGWPASGTNILKVTAAVTQVPKNVCVGQIFQANGPSKPLCELQ